MLSNALQEGLYTSLPLASFLTYGGFILLQQFGAISLTDLARHNHTEHLASLAHGDPVPWDAEYAPSAVDLELLEQLMGDANLEKGGFDVESCAKARVRREAAYAGDLDMVHAIIGRGEMALTLGILGGEDKVVPSEMLRRWFVEERFPEGWKPTRRWTLTGTLLTQLDMRIRMGRIRREMEKAKAKVKNA
ncbi:hypothetical protein NEOLEDRAFT_1136873 [Neolentinus lepideus HHB14362 ss-1]|uniref:Heme haloperoxidase family profile domain-containing protein n=1 Tax=Neolentinus lepideus HHB14362 ss-1 TaxID=1314782 RepID=A0A165R2V4_9AGAM|nr:hypothetical protein NEOLEDRAFT_1136873 [Neolentinus lepideus HHB14362 ss-1]